MLAHPVTHSGFRLQHDDLTSRTYSHLPLYNSYRFRFNLVELRSLDFGLFDDCIAVLKMDYQPEVDVHERIENGSAIWESLASQWKNNETENDKSN
ncbi:DUF7673 family protein [Klebsiella pneumoniae]